MNLEPETHQAQSSEDPDEGETLQRRYERVARPVSTVTISPEASDSEESRSSGSSRESGNLSISGDVADLQETDTESSPDTGLDSDEHADSDATAKGHPVGNMQLCLRVQGSHEAAGSLPDLKLEDHQIEPASQSSDTSAQAPLDSALMDPALSDPTGGLECECSPQLKAVVRVSQTEANPGRRFFGCRYGRAGCK